MEDHLLLSHLHTYPAMEIADMVKLLYQNEFGTGHMLPSPEEALTRIETERAGLPAIPGRPLTEDIGNRRCRLYLNAEAASTLSSDTIARLFQMEGEEESGTRAGFEEKLEQLQTLCRRGDLPFDESALAHYLVQYKEAGYPPVSHSQGYREAYCPAYRVVGDKVMAYQSLLLAIDSLRGKKKAVHIAIDGPCASGKSTLGTWLSRVYPNGNLLHMDDFFLPLAAQTPERLATPGNNVDHERFQREVAASLEAGIGFTYRPFSCREQAYQEGISMAPGEVNIIEGAYSLHPSLAELYDIKVFLTVSPEVQRQRILKRNGPEMLLRFQREWIPLEEAYFNAYSIQSGCDFVYPAADL